jgi:thiamine-monophosphate kinase
MNEHATITTMAQHFQRAPDQRNAHFACDAEVIERNGHYELFTLDEFSADEDRFCDTDAAQLGATLATATLSDIVAAGGTPTYFMQAVCLPPGTPEPFANLLAEGIAHVLKACNCHLIGGDLGQAPAWRFTGWAMGTCQRPITRILPPEPLELWISGPLGAVNAALVGNHPTPCLPLRFNLVPLLQAHAAACIDTSSGLWDALWTLHRQNPHHQIQLNLGAVPLAPLARTVCQQAQLPPAASLIGAAGEYELLMALPKHAAPAFAAAGATWIGQATPMQPAAFVVTTHQHTMPAPPCPDPRSMPYNDYIHAVTTAAQNLA